ncbi:hypothetical protein HAX54_031316, partial [Datura stramonium]|nr:hypothetical protein [Datura stramonium]
MEHRFGVILASDHYLVPTLHQRFPYGDRRFIALVLIEYMLPPVFNFSLAVNGNQRIPSYGPL